MEPSDESTLAYLREENIRLQNEVDGLRQTYKQTADDRDLFHKQARVLDLLVEEYKQALQDIVELNSHNNVSPGGLACIAERALSWQEDLKRHAIRRNKEKGHAAP